MQLLTVIFLIGSFAAVYVGLFRYRPIDLLAPAILFVLGFAMVGLFLRDGRREPKKPTASYLAAALLPWIVAGLFFANGALDRSEEVRHPTVVVETHYGTRIGSNRLTVRSWRPGHTTESIYVSAFQPFFFEGQQITFGTKSGALGIPWISRVFR